MRKKLLMEIHLSGIAGTTPEGRADAVLGLQERYDHDYSGTSLRVMPYSAFTGCRYLGGRSDGLPLEGPDGLRRVVHAFNRRGIPIMVTLNGGLLVDEGGREVDLVGDERLAGERALLELLTENSVTFGVTNAVTILSTALEAAAQRHFPEVKTIASCIRFYDRGREEYARAFAASHGVAAANQDIAYVLREFPEHSHKLLMFLRFDCTSASVVCRLHMLREEAAAKGFDRYPPGDATPEQLLEELRCNPLIDASHYSEVLDSTRARLGCVKGDTPLHPDPDRTLETALRQGVWQFKIPSSGQHALAEDTPRTIGPVAIAAIQDVLDLVQASPPT